MYLVLTKAEPGINQEITKRNPGIILVLKFSNFNLAQKRVGLKKKSRYVITRLPGITTKFQVGDKYH